MLLKHNFIKNVMKKEKRPKKSKKEQIKAQDKVEPPIKEITADPVKTENIDDKLSNESHSQEKLNNKPLEQLPQEENNKNQKMDKELYWIFGVMVGLVIVFLAASAVFQSFKTFEYQGLTFTKEKFGEIPVFRHSFYTDNLASITGAVTDEDKDRGYFSLVLRGDPRENNVPIDGEIRLSAIKGAYISVNGTGLTQCEYSAPGISSLTSFLVGNGLNVKGAVPDEEEAREAGVLAVNCENTPNSDVILIKAGSETRITIKENCYEVTISNCEVLPAVEKFMVQTILDARERL